MSDRVSAGQGETAEQAAAKMLLAELKAVAEGSPTTMNAAEAKTFADSVARLLVRVRELTDERDEARAAEGLANIGRFFTEQRMLGAGRDEERRNELQRVARQHTAEQYERRVQEAERALRAIVAATEGPLPSGLARLTVKGLALAALGGDGQQEGPVA